jgi:uncharacterized RDD family membrane protein YckC
MSGPRPNAEMRGRRHPASVAVVDPLDGVVPRRLLQAAVDQGLVFVVFFVLLNVAVFTHDKVLLWVAFGLLLALPFTVHVLLAARSGRTPAMRMTGLRIVTTAGTRPRFTAYVIRWLLMIADGALFGLVGLVVILATSRRQRIGDIVAGTMVVRSLHEPVPPRPDGDLGAVPRAQLPLH